MTILYHEGGGSTVVLWGRRAYLSSGPDCENVWTSRSGFSWANRIKKGVPIRSFRVDGNVDDLRTLITGPLGLYEYQAERVVAVLDVELGPDHHSSNPEIIVRVLDHIRPNLPGEPTVTREYDGLGKVTLPVSVAERVQPIKWLAAWRPQLPEGAHNTGRFAVRFDGPWEVHHRYYGRSLRSFRARCLDDVPERYRGEMFLNERVLVVRQFNEPNYEVLWHENGQTWSETCCIDFTAPWPEQVAKFRESLAGAENFPGQFVDEVVQWIAGDLTCPEDEDEEKPQEGSEEELETIGA